MNLKIYDAFPTKVQADKTAQGLRKEVQYVRVKKLTGRLKYGVYLGGRGSGMFV